MSIQAVPHCKESAMRNESGYQAFTFLSTFKMERVNSSCLRYIGFS